MGCNGILIPVLGVDGNAYRDIYSILLFHKCEEND